MDTPLIGCPVVRRVRQKYERGKCEGIIITLPAKSFGGGGIYACKLQKLAGLRLVHGQDRIIVIMLNLLCNDNNALAFYAYL